MKKYFLIVLSVLCFIKVANAQTDGKRGFLAVSIGSSTPLGKFQSTDANDESAGAAVNGTNYAASFGYRNGKYFGISVFVFNNKNNYDINGLVSSSGMPGTYEPGLSYTWEASPYSVTGMMLGPIVSKTFNKVTLHAKVMAGLFFADSPEITLTVTDGTSTSAVKGSKASILSYGYDVGAIVQYNFAKQFALTCNIDYLTSTFEFPAEPIVDAKSGVTLSYGSSTIIPFDVINIGIGMAYIF